MLKLLRYLFSSPKELKWAVDKKRPKKSDRHNNLVMTAEDGEEWIDYAKYWSGISAGEVASLLRGITKP